MDNNTPNMKSEIEPGVKIYNGSCFCGDVKFTLEADLTKLKSGRCNCTFCVKTRLWTFRLESVDQFKLLTPLENMNVHKDRFHTCKKCTVLTHAKGDYGEGPYCTVSVNCIDDLSPEQKSNLKIVYYDGLHNNWWNPPAITNYL